MLHREAGATGEVHGGQGRELDAAAIGVSLNKSAIALIKKFQANGVSLDALKTAIVLAEKGELK